MRKFIPNRPFTQNYLHSYNGEYLTSKTLNDSIWNTPLTKVNSCSSFNDKNIFVDSGNNFHLFEFDPTDDQGIFYSSYVDNHWNVEIRYPQNYYWTNRLDVAFKSNLNVFYLIYTQLFNDGNTQKGWIYFQTRQNDTGIESNSILPLNTVLYQNYPNPFNPVTQIKFDLAKAGKVELGIYNITGQLVKSLIDEKLNAGNHSVMFKADDLNSGLYYYTLTTGGKSFTKKMLMVK